jgi:uncharacterized membrane protein
VATRQQEQEKSEEFGTVRRELEETIRAEHGLTRSIIVGVVIAVPLCVALWVVVIALAVEGTGSLTFGLLAMAAGLGLVTGIFFGTWAGFVAKTHTFEDLDRRANLEGHRRET